MINPIEPIRKSENLLLDESYLKNKIPKEKKMKKLTKDAIARKSIIINFLFNPEFLYAYYFPSDDEYVYILFFDPTLKREFVDTDLQAFYFYENEMDDPDNNMEIIKNPYNMGIGIANEKEIKLFEKRKMSFVDKFYVEDGIKFSREDFKENLEELVKL